MITHYFGDRAKFSKFLFLSTLTFVLAQQIYFPQTHKYFHLAVLFVFMIFTDSFRSEFRNYTREYLINGIVAFASIVTIAEHLFSIQLSLVYLAALIGAVAIASSLFIELKDLVGTEDAKLCLKEDSLKAFEKGPRFMKVLLYGLMGVLLLAAAYAVYAIFLLFI